MSTQFRVSLAAALLITAGLFVSLASIYRAPPVAPPTTIDGLPVTDLPGITVHPPTTADTVATPRNGHGRTVAIVSSDHTFDRLLEVATSQVTSSHLSMPYYSFGSHVEHISKD